MNVYGFVGNMPITLIDRLGLSFIGFMPYPSFPGFYDRRTQCFSDKQFKECGRKKCRCYLDDLIDCVLSSGRNLDRIQEQYEERLARCPTEGEEGAALCRALADAWKYHRISAELGDLLKCAGIAEGEFILCSAYCFDKASYTKPRGQPCEPGDRTIFIDEGGGGISIGSF